MNGNKIKIVICNSHSGNRGDEAAQRAMLKTINKFFDNIRFTVITRLPEGLELFDDVEVLKFVSYQKKFPFFNFPFAVLWFLLKLVKIDLANLFSKCDFLRALKRMSEADVVISCPGGPYIGDKYTSHEISEHLFLLYLACFFKKPFLIYGPSMGPFKIKWRNRIRRYILNKAKTITIRDSISKSYFDELGVTGPLVYLTSDSAFQWEVKLEDEVVNKAAQEDGVFYKKTEQEKKSIFIGFTPASVRANFPYSDNFKEDQRNYNVLMSRFLDGLVDKYNAIIVIFPQLFAASSDLGLITDIVSLMNNKRSVRVLSQNRNSDVQQRLISKMNFMIGNRYHSIIFGIKAAVPTICISYEHKSSGVMKTAKMDDYLIDAKDIGYEVLSNMFAKLFENRDSVREQLRIEVEVLKKQAFMNSVVAAAVVNCYKKNTLERTDIQKEVSTLVNEHSLVQLYGN